MSELQCSRAVKYDYSDWQLSAEGRTEELNDHLKISLRGVANLWFGPHRHRELLKTAKKVYTSMVIIAL